MSKKYIIVECGGPPGLFSPHPTTEVNRFGEYARVIVKDAESGEETEVFRGDEFSEENYTQRLVSKGESPRGSRQPPS